jgi:hypothetical protein
LALKRRKLTINEEEKIIREVEKNPTVLRNEIVKCCVLPPLSLNNITLQKASVLEEENCCGAYSEERKKALILLIEQGSVLYY